jgi:hypothetical protein
VRVLLWHTDTDTLEHGQWFKGRIYEHRCDLSPDGSLFVYFASKISARTKQDTEYTYAWTAITRPPWLTALALWPKGDCWHGGGLFLDKRTLWLNHRSDVAKPHKDHQPKGLRVIPNPEAYGEDEPIYYRRLERDGWVMLQEGSFEESRDEGWPAVEPRVWEKPNSARERTLVMRFHGYLYKTYGSPRVFRYSLLDKLEGSEVPIEGATWADWDQQGRLVFARDGKLLAQETPGAAPTVITDLNGQEPESIVSPEQARHW